MTPLHSRRQHAWLPASLIGLVAMVAGPMPSAHAAPRKISLSWLADPGCMTSEELTKAVEWTLGRPVFGADAEPRISGRVHARRSGGFEAVLTMEAPDERDPRAPTHVVAQRSLTADTSCRELDDGMAVVAALMVDALGDEPAVLRSPEHSHVLTPWRRPLLVAFDLGGGVTYGLLPAVAGMAAIRGEVSLPWIPPVAVTLRVHTPSSTIVATTPNPAGGTFSAWDGELAVCPAVERGGVRFGGCAAVGGGTLSGSPYGAVLAGDTIVRPLFVISALPYGAIRLWGEVWLRAEAGVVVPLERDTWGFDAPRGYVGVFRPGAAIPLTSLSVELRTGP